MNKINQAANAIQDVMFERKIKNNPLRYVTTLAHFESINSDFTNNIVKPHIQNMNEADKLKVIRIVGQIKIW